MTKLKNGQQIVRSIDAQAINPSAKRDLVVTVSRAGITFRGAGRHAHHLLTWQDVLLRFDDLRKELR